MRESVGPCLCGDPECRRCFPGYIPDYPYGDRVGDYEPAGTQPWESINDTTWRLPVPGGWFFRVSGFNGSAACFVPTPPPDEDTLTLARTVVRLDEDGQAGTPKRHHASSLLALAVIKQGEK